MDNEQQSRTARHSKDPKQSKAKQGNKNNKPKKGRGKKIFLTTFITLLVITCLAFLGGVALFWSYAKDAPKLEDDKLVTAQNSVLLGSKGEELVDLGSANRDVISPQDVPQQLEDAIISVEDRRFYKHIGVDPIRIIGSFISNLRGSGGLQGGSTLTQQLIKLSYFSTKQSDQTLKRKAQEAWMSIELEKTKSKQEILTYYINRVYMSNGLTGMETAAQVYFGKTLRDLSLSQTALIAGMPQAPSSYDPYVYPEYAKQRRDIVLGTMLDNEKITQKEYDEAVATPIDDGLLPLKPASTEWKYYDPIITQVMAEIEAKTGKDPANAGMKIHTTIDVNLQLKLYDIVNSDQYVQYPDPDMQVATTVIDTHTGKVLAQIGGRHFPEDSSLNNNLAVNTARDLGSTMKPVTDYGPAFENLKISTGKYIKDEPYKYPGTNISVNNWDGRYMGNITVRKALTESRNVPAVKLFNEVGADKVKTFLGNLGIQYKNLEMANAISSNSEQDGTKYGASTEKMAAAYAAFANGGTYYKPQYVSKIEYQDGSVDEFTPEGKQAMSSATAYMVTDILKDVISEGTGNNAAIPGLIQAGKTGTSNYTEEDLANLANMGITGTVYPDVAFTGYTPNIAISVWAGYNGKSTPIYEQYGTIASDVYRETMAVASQNSYNEDWSLPDDLIRVGKELYYKDNYKVETPVKPSVAPSSSSSIPSSETSSSSTATSSSSVTPPPVESTVPSSSQEPPVQSTEPSSSSSGGNPGGGGTETSSSGGNP